MKHKAISTAVVTAMLALGMVGNASAKPSYGPFNLTEGNTSSKLLSGVDHYRLQVNGNSNVII